ncbi:MAG: topoisomerase [Candidatus Thermoplasmatota archaeon]|nr:topoisomerase [Candidatus Thermoplasmatota archaeon]MBS3789809.1 topoisomerase [Candidatus Thermoplasmatota archaeon]
MRLKEELEGILNILDRMKNEDKAIPVIVEGRKDMKALRSLGFERKIIKIKKGKTIFRIIEGLRGDHEKVIILTDWDSSGGKLCYKIKKACESNDIKYDVEYRKQLIKYLKKEVKDVESIPTFIKRAKRDLNPRKRNFRRGKT